MKLINSPHKISHKSRKTAPIFTTFTHSASLDSMNKHKCCGLQRIARTHQTKKCGVSPATASLPELLYIVICHVHSLCDNTGQRTLSSIYLYQVLTLSRGTYLHSCKASLHVTVTTIFMRSALFWDIRRRKPEIKNVFMQNMGFTEIIRGPG
jgi:hypothetical protein